MKVLHVTPAYFPATYWGGPIYSVLGLNDALVRLGVHLTVLTTDSAGPRRAQRLRFDRDSRIAYPSGHEIHYCRRIAGAHVSLEMVRRLIPLVRSADVVHLTSTYSFPTIPALMACRALHKPLVWSPRGALLATHEWTGARRRGLKRLWELACARILANTSSVFHVTSPEEQSASLARIPLNDARVIPNGVEIPAHLSKREWLPNGKLRLLFLGRLDPKKGIENLFQAMTVMADPNIILEVCGTGNDSYRNHLSTLATGLSIDKQIRFVGHVDGDEKTRAFARADLCIAPSHSENFCMVIAEALAHGVPVIASTGTPWPKLPERDCGEWIPNSAESLAAGIRRMRSQNLEQMGLRGRTWMQQDFSWDRAAKLMHELYRNLVDSRRA